MKGSIGLWAHARQREAGAIEALSLTQGPALLSALFYGAATVVAVWELICARRDLTRPSWARWLGNIGLGVLNSVLNRWLVSIAGISAAIVAEQQNWGALNQLHLPPWLAILTGVMLLDCAQYFVHRGVHAVPALWRLHLVHHSDPDCDFSTSLRHHPLEFVLNSGFGLAIVAVLGVPVGAVLLYTLVTASFDLFRHANIGLPAAVDRCLRLAVVTPDMHRVHHSAVEAETKSNYSSLFSWWDRLFGTYCAQPAAGHQGMTIGLEYFRTSRELWPHRIFTQPFRSTQGSAGLRETAGTLLVTSPRQD